MKLRFLASLSLAALTGGAFSSVTHAVPYDVNSMGTLIGTFSGNTPNGPGTFYKFNDGGSEEGTATAFFQTAIGGGGTNAHITWSGSQPLLNLLYLKASNGYVAWDISNFNLGNYDSIDVGNLGLLTNKKGKSQGISHVQIGGELTNVPDAGSTLLLLGLGLAGLLGLRRLRRA